MPAQTALNKSSETQLSFQIAAGTKWHLYQDGTSKSGLVRNHKVITALSIENNKIQYQVEEIFSPYQNYKVHLDIPKSKQEMITHFYDISALKTKEEINHNPLKITSNNNNQDNNKINPGLSILAGITPDAVLNQGLVKAWVKTNDMNRLNDNQSISPIQKSLQILEKYQAFRTPTENKKTVAKISDIETTKYNAMPTENKHAIYIDLVNAHHALKIEPDLSLSLMILANQSLTLEKIHVLEKNENLEKIGSVLENLQRMTPEFLKEHNYIQMRITTQDVKNIYNNATNKPEERALTALNKNKNFLSQDTVMAVTESLKKHERSEIPAYEVAQSMKEIADTNNRDMHTYIHKGETRNLIEGRPILISDFEALGQEMIRRETQREIQSVKITTERLRENTVIDIFKTRTPDSVLREGKFRVAFNAKDIEHTTWESTNLNLGSRAYLILKESNAFRNSKNNSSENISERMEKAAKQSRNNTNGVKQIIVDIDKEILQIMIQKNDKRLNALRFLGENSLRKVPEEKLDSSVKRTENSFTRIKKSIKVEENQR